MMSRLAYDGAGISPETFQHILKERLLERKEKRKAHLQKNIQRINELKSKDGIDPLDQFPKEIWDIILKELGPSDRGNMWEIHPLFQEIMKSTRIRDILFPQIVSMEVPEFWKTKTHKRGCGCCRFFEEKPTSPLARHLLLRKVSKSMRDAIDSWFEDNLLKMMRTGETDNSDIPCLSLNVFRDKTFLQNVIANFSEGNPRFFMRALDITFSADFPYCEMGNGERFFQGNFNQFKVNVTTLLEKIGDQILYFHFFVPNIDILDRGGVDRSEVYLILRQWLTQMPNLKWLSFYTGLMWGAGSGSRGRRCVNRAIQGHPFPKLEKLERMCVRFDENCLEAFDIFEAALESNKHVSMVNINANPEALRLFLPASVRSLTQVSSFTLSQENTSECFKMPVIQELINLQWPLKRLSLPVDLEKGPMNSLFEFLEKFPTLEELSVEMDSVKIEKDSDMAFLKLPNLTRLEFTFDAHLNFNANIHFFFSLQFLIECTKLRKLSWENRSIEAFPVKRHMKNHECHERMINFRAGFRDLRFSNIWDVFPCLEHVHLSLSDESVFYEEECHRLDRLY